MYLSKYCCKFSKTKLLNNFTILYSIANVNSTLSIINNVLLSKLKLSTFLDPHFIAVLIGLLKTSSALTVNPDKAIRDIKKRLDKTIKDVKKSGDPKKIEKLRLELQRLNSIGGAKKIVPNEGIVFQYKGKTFKLTGTFASVNQILGIFF